jgi:hypothetical protein
VTAVGARLFIVAALTVKIVIKKFTTDKFTHSSLFRPRLMATVIIITIPHHRFTIPLLAPDK